jgi:hypothetical protein
METTQRVPKARLTSREVCREQLGEVDAIFSVQRYAERVEGDRCVDWLLLDALLQVRVLGFWGLGFRV